MARPTASPATEATACETAAERPLSTAPARLPLRVAVFSDSLPERNGTGAYYHDLAAHLSARLEALEVFQPRVKRRINALSIPMPGDPGQRLYTPDLFRIGRAFHAMRPHIVVSVTPGPFGLLGRYHAWRRGAAFITAFHTDFEQLARIYWNPVSRTLVNAVLRSANRFLCRRSAAVLVNNSALESDVRRLGAGAVEVMGTPLPPEFLRRPPRPARDGIHQVCFAGRLAAEKNVHRIIEAAAQFPGVRFVIGGDGPLRGELEQLARGAGNIRFTGWLDRDALIDLLDASDLLLLPSRLETFGSIALEAMARGRPALVSANAGIHDWAVLKPGLFSLSPQESLAAAIARLLALPTSTWPETAAAARAAAETLNHDTLDQWIRVLSHYAGGDA